MNPDLRSFITKF